MDVSDDSSVIRNTLPSTSVYLQKNLSIARRTFCDAIAGQLLLNWFNTLFIYGQLTHRSLRTTDY